jgi:RNase P subunit RPR2
MIGDYGCQPNEIERVACSGCAGFLRLETSIPRRINQPRYDVMRCVSCSGIQWVAREKIRAIRIYPRVH